MILMMVGMLQLVQATVCCPINQNCTIIETCQDGGCGTCYMTIYNQTGAINQTGNMGNVSDYVYEYNLSVVLNEFGEYPYVINCSTGDTCSAGDCQIEVKQMCEDVEMSPIAIIILLPIFLAFFYLIVSYLLRGASHWAFSVALLLLSFVEFFRAYNYAVVSLVKYYNFTELQDLIGTGTYSFGIMYGVIITYFIIHMIIVMTLGLWDKKRKKIGEYGEYEW